MTNTFNEREEGTTSHEENEPNRNPQEDSHEPRKGSQNSTGSESEGAETSEDSP